MFTVEFELKGLTPLLMHADDIEAADVLTAWRKDPKNKNLSAPGDDRSPAWTWQTYMYAGNGLVVIPAGSLAVALRQAGARKIMKKQTTYKEVTQSGMLVTGPGDSEFLEFRFNGGKTLKVADYLKFKEAAYPEHIQEAKRLGFSLFAKRAKIGTSKHIRVRARFDSWTAKGSVRVWARELTLPIVEELFTLAGSVGLCDWRPGCKTPGPFGMFSATVKQIK